MANIKYEEDPGLAARVREALGAPPTAADVEACAEAVALLEMAADRVGRVRNPVHPREPWASRTTSYIASALTSARAELAAMRRAMEPLSVGDALRGTEQVGPDGVRDVEGEFRGVRRGFVVLRVRGRGLVAFEHRLPLPGATTGLHWEERHRVERWCADQEKGGAR